MNSKENFKVFLKYIISSGISFVIDIGVFTCVEFILLYIIDEKAIIIATIIARIISSLFNYYVNSRHVFKSYDNYSIFKYYALVIMQMFISATGVYWLNIIVSNVYDFILKIFVDGCIFIVNYFIQRRFVF